jgi:hypothetical protein
VDHWQAHRRAALDDAIDRLDRDEQLDEFTRPEVLEILQALRDGRDARELLGIKPRRGAPPVTTKYRMWIAQHYHKLRSVPGSKESADAQHVADAWKVGIQTVRKCFDEHRNIAYQCPALDQIEQIAKYYGPEYARFRRKG